MIHHGRGESENRIKDYKLALKADRLSCHRFVANQFRLLLHAAAYWLLDVVRWQFVAAGREQMQLDTLRLRLHEKIDLRNGGKVRQLLTRIKLHLASGHPDREFWHSLGPVPRE